eukprot:CAMPEP_0174287026 /NCGR_PEP_ID=MMETSP0809-20121228/14116_1 /TAXON_ID=73025 ORGANISM="Eutreptiella gymnastica-like, Strain CCMP1594" /NCGR_SAMPLE_ID=MMETSP0809 /ASSEMBLY_ACC=CAM_ASM_000658 /LENGTH=182 /DNA_ID=CAMNT_0015383355 /DNA_START=70 /DNA_END=618 /DNA_ORIENTATION=-
MPSSLDPNNTAWSKDKSRFGFLMLQKMGWQEGSGLGKEQQGMTEHIKVKKLEDGAGLGANEENGHMSWTIHKDAFDKVLSKLKTKTFDPASISSDEDSELASPLTPLTPSSFGKVRPRENDEDYEKRRQKKQFKKALKEELERQYVERGLTEEQIAMCRAEDKKARKAKRDAKRAARRAAES